jgi:hypothetical protein
VDLGLSPAGGTLLSMATTHEQTARDNLALANAVAKTDDAKAHQAMTAAIVYALLDVAMAIRASKSS